MYQLNNNAAPLDLSGVKLIIFDKDGTLIDFHAMWGGWIAELARRLEAASGLAVRDQLFRAVGYDHATQQIAPTGLLAIGTMAELRATAIDLLHENGLEASDAAVAVDAAWFIPDPVTLAVPRADLPRLFGTLHEKRIKLAVATTDDRAPTLATLHALGIAALVAAVACGDDGVSVKPAPDAVLGLCAKLGVDAVQTMMVGDTIADLQMARAAGATAIGVLGGVGTAEALAPYADVLLPSVAALLNS